MEDGESRRSFLSPFDVDVSGSSELTSIFFALLPPKLDILFSRRLNHLPFPLRRGFHCDEPGVRRRFPGSQAFEDLYRSEFHSIGSPRNFTDRIPFQITSLPGGTDVEITVVAATKAV